MTEGVHSKVSAEILGHNHLSLLVVVLRVMTRAKPAMELWAVLYLKDETLYNSISKVLGGIKGVRFKMNRLTPRPGTPGLWFQDLYKGVSRGALSSRSKKLEYWLLTGLLHCTSDGSVGTTISFVASHGITKRTKNKPSRVTRGSNHHITKSKYSA